jgi:lipoprotein-releasing system ATP-binding protein
MTATDHSRALIDMGGVRKSYNLGLPSEAEVLHGVSLQVRRGEFIALIGPSGSGKSTLLNIVGLLEGMSTGSYRLQGQEVFGLDDATLTLLRRSTLGFVFQFHHLLPAFTALENVTLPALMRGGHVSTRQREHARALLASVGLAKAMDKRPAELSGGMQQRVAIARALVMEPALVLADEPTGNLDTTSSDEVFVQLRRMHVELGTTFVVVTRCHGDRCCRLLRPRPGSPRLAAHFPLQHSDQVALGLGQLGLVAVVNLAKKRGAFGRAGFFRILDVLVVSHQCLRLVLDQRDPVVFEVADGVVVGRSLLHGNSW